MLTLFVLLVVLSAAGCGGNGSSGGGDGQVQAAEAQKTSTGVMAADESDPAATEAQSEGTADSEDLPDLESDPETALSPAAAGYRGPEMRVSSFHEDAAEGENGALIDLSCASDGYVGVSAKSSGRLKFQVLKDGETYTYDLHADGTSSIFPLQMGDGMYSFRVLENVSDSKYAVLYSADRTISISDSFAPYLCASDYVNYTSASACVIKAQDLAASAEDANGVVKAVYEYVCAGVKYDKAKAQSVQSGYLPDPDETLSTGKGICFDYASLAAAMLRSQGIPCKVIFGYVSPNEVYHAWNMFYTEESGWITVKFEISGKKWNRMDLTFSANGADGTFIGDGSNYKDVYMY